MKRQPILRLYCTFSEMEIFLEDKAFQTWIGKSILGNSDINS